MIKLIKKKMIVKASTTPVWINKTPGKINKTPGKINFRTERELL